jgi:hypothetical protein
MNKIIIATVTGLLLTSSTSLAQPADGSVYQEMPAISNALEIAIGGGYMRSAGDIGRGMASVDDLTSDGGGAELSVAYRMTPNLAVGVYGTVSGYDVGPRVAPTTDMAVGATLGVKADWHFRPTMAIDPWVSIGAGWRGLWLGNENETERALHGIELTRGSSASLPHRTDVRTRRTSVRRSMFVARTRCPRTATRRSRTTS